MRTLSSSSRARLGAPLLGLLLLAVLAAGCRKAREPSAEYAEAHQRFSQLYAQHLDEAFVHPEMAQIEALLARVPAESLDAPGARELQARIEQGRTRVLAARAAGERDLAEARAPLAMPAGAGGDPGERPGEQAPEAPDAGPPADAGEAAGPRVGSDEKEVAHGFRGCFQRWEDVSVVGRGMRPTYEMADRLSCRLEYPALVGQLVVVEAGKVLMVAPKASVRPAGTADAGR